MIYDTTQYAENHAELSHEPRGLRDGHAKVQVRGASIAVLGANAEVYNLFNLGHHLVSAET